MARSPVAPLPTTEGMNISADDGRTPGRVTSEAIPSPRRSRIGTEDSPSSMSSGHTQKLVEISRDLRGSLKPIVEEYAGAGTRPALLVHRLDIDRSLAGRITRAIRFDDDLEFIHVLPAPTGLRIFLEAAERAGLDADRLKSAETSVDRFHALIDETPGGRATLDAAISAHSEQAREKNEKSAKQAVYKAMSYLLGIQCDGITSASILRPSDDGKRVDLADLNSKLGIRRLRPTAPIGLFGYRLDPVDGDGGEVPGLTTLDGRRAENAEDFVVQDFSDSHPSLQSFETAGEGNFALSEDGPPPDTSLTLTLGMLVRRAIRRYRTPGQADDCRTYSLPFPCRTLVRDVFVHRDLFDGAEPLVTQFIPRMMRPENALYEGERGRLDRVDMAAPVERLGTGLHRAAVKEIPDQAGLLEYAFETTGWDPDDFHGYRVRVTYPVPFIHMSWWFRQTPAPGEGPE